MTVKLISPEEFSKISETAERYFSSQCYVKVETEFKYTAVQYWIDIFPIKVWVSILVKENHCQMSIPAPSNEEFWSGQLPESIDNFFSLAEFARVKLLEAMSAKDI